MDNKKILQRSVGLSTLALAVGLLMGCGQKGPLVLPKSSASAASAASAAVKP